MTPTTNQPQGQDDRLTPRRGRARELSPLHLALRARLRDDSSRHHPAAPSGKINDNNNRREVGPLQASTVGPLQVTTPSSSSARS